MEKNIFQKPSSTSFSLAKPNGQTGTNSNNPAIHPLSNIRAEQSSNSLLIENYQIPIEAGSFGANLGSLINENQHSNDLNRSKNSLYLEKSHLNTNGSNLGALTKPENLNTKGTVINKNYNDGKSSVNPRVNPNNINKPSLFDSRANQLNRPNNNPQHMPLQRNGPVRSENVTGNGKTIPANGMQNPLPEKQVNPKNQKGPSQQNVQAYLGDFYKRLQKMPGLTAPQLSKLPKISVLKPTLEENKSFFSIISTSDLEKNEYKTFDFNFKPQPFEIPGGLFEEFQKNVGMELQQTFTSLSEIMSLIDFYQKFLEFKCTLEREEIQEHRSISEAFGGLSSHIWAYVQKHFNVESNGISQDFPFIEVSERISSQQMFEEIKNNSNLESTKLKFSELFNTRLSQSEYEDIRCYYQYLLKFGILDQKLQHLLFGDINESSGQVIPTKPIPSITNQQLEHDFQVISQHFQAVTQAKTQESLTNSYKNEHEDLVYNNQEPIPDDKKTETQISKVGGYSEYLMDIEGGFIGVPFYLGSETADISNYNYGTEEEFTLQYEN